MSDPTPTGGEATADSGVPSSKPPADTSGNPPVVPAADLVAAQQAQRELLANVNSLKIIEASIIEIDKRLGVPQEQMVEAALTGEKKKLEEEKEKIKKAQKKMLDEASEGNTAASTAPASGTEDADVELKQSKEAVEKLKRAADAGEDVDIAPLIPSSGIPPSDLMSAQPATPITPETPAITLSPAGSSPAKNTAVGEQRQATPGKGIMSTQDQKPLTFDAGGATPKPGAGKGEMDASAKKEPKPTKDLNVGGKEDKPDKSKRDWKPEKATWYNIFSILFGMLMKKGYDPETARKAAKKMADKAVESIKDFNAKVKAEETALDGKLVALENDENVLNRQIAKNSQTLETLKGKSPQTVENGRKIADLEGKQLKMIEAKQLYLKKGKKPLVEKLRDRTTKEMNAFLKGKDKDNLNRQDTEELAKYKNAIKFYEDAIKKIEKGETIYLSEKYKPDPANKTQSTPGAANAQSSMPTLSAVEQSQPSSNPTPVATPAVESPAPVSITLAPSPDVSQPQPPQTSSTPGASTPAGGAPPDTTATIPVPVAPALETTQPQTPLQPVVPTTGTSASTPGSAAPAPTPVAAANAPAVDKANPADALAPQPAVQTAPEVPVQPAQPQAVQPVTAAPPAAISNVTPIKRAPLQEPSAEPARLAAADTALTAMNVSASDALSERPVPVPEARKEARKDMVISFEQMKSNIFDDERYNIEEKEKVPDKVVDETPSSTAEQRKPSPAAP